MPNTLTRIIATASRFSKSRAKPAMIPVRLPVKPALPLQDESLREPDFAFVAEEGVRAVVIKPTLTGSTEKVREQVQAAHALGLTAVISSSIESSLGLTQLARIAAVNARHHSGTGHAGSDAGAAGSSLAGEPAAVSGR
ncbi:hypothetical protein ECZU51_55740 [Escherichia coli]|nr:hypothetical protein ECZU51_55740 [Escherichia coli]